MTIEMQNNLEADGSVNPPLKFDGTLYRYCMYFDNSKSVVFSDELSVLLARLVPGYEALDFNARKEERRALLNSIANAKGTQFELLEYDAPDEPNSLGFASEDATLRSLHKLGEISFFTA